MIVKFVITFFVAIQMAIEDVITSKVNERPSPGLSGTNEAEEPPKPTIATEGCKCGTGWQCMGKIKNVMG
jgi:hypothetical protein